MEKLHILLVCPQGKNYGLIKQTGTLALALNGVGFRVSVLVGRAETTPLENLGPEVNVRHIPPKKRPFGHLIKRPGPIQNKFIQHLHFSRALKTALAEDNTIDIVHLMNVDYPHSQLANLPAGLQMPVVGHVNRAHTLQAGHLRFWQRKRQRAALALLEPMILSNHALLETAKNEGYEKVALIPYGVRTEQFKPALSKRPVRRALGLPEKATLICCMADVKPQNAQLEALEKCQPLSADRQLLLIGDVKDPEYRARISQRADEKNMADFVHFLAPQTNPEDYLKASDVFILLGGIENRHSTILEAQSAGVPVVLGPSESSLMLCNGNRTGVVLYANNPLAKQAFNKLISDATYRQGRAMNARPFVVKSFSFKGMLASYCRLYQSL